ncbi:MAG: DUF3467 domain-containing protein [Bryobacteraceae bacterium]
MSSQPAQPRLHISNTADYREGYANSVQIRMSLWDFCLGFGVMNQTTPDAVNIQLFQSVYLSPQQAKALANMLNQNVTQYESTFGEIRLGPQTPGGVIQ